MSTWPDIERPACEHCGHPEAMPEDYDKYAEGEGEHLCWGEPFICEEWARERIANPPAPEITDEMVERAARAYYMADKEVTEAGWDAALSMARDEYRLAARIVLVAAFSTKETHNERSA